MSIIRWQTNENKNKMSSDSNCYYLQFNCLLKHGYGSTHMVIVHMLATIGQHGRAADGRPPCLIEFNKGHDQPETNVVLRSWLFLLFDNEKFHFIWVASRELSEIQHSGLHGRRSGQLILKPIPLASTSRIDVFLRCYRQSGTTVQVISPPLGGWKFHHFFLVRGYQLSNNLKC